MTEDWAVAGRTCRQRWRPDRLPAPQHGSRERPGWEQITRAHEERADALAGAPSPSEHQQATKKKSFILWEGMGVAFKCQLSPGWFPGGLWTKGPCCLPHTATWRAGACALTSLLHRRQPHGQQEDTGWSAVLIGAEGPTAIVSELWCCHPHLVLYSCKEVAMARARLQGRLWGEGDWAPGSRKPINCLWRLKDFIKNSTLVCNTQLGCRASSKS